MIIYGRQQLTFSVFVLILAIATQGCRSKKNTGDSDASESADSKNLEAIGDAYVRATNSLRRPPENLDELLPILKDFGKPEELLMSTVDKQNFEIVWGVELRMLKAKGDEVPIIAYERTGKDGMRNVLRGRSEVLQMSESKLKSGKFPEGYKLPF